MKINFLGFILGALLLSACQTTPPSTPDEKVDTLSGLKEMPVTSDPTGTLNALAEREREENSREILRSVTDPVFTPSITQDP